MSGENEESFTTVAVNTTMEDEKKEEELGAAAVDVMDKVNERDETNQAVVIDADNNNQQQPALVLADQGVMECIESDEFETPALWRRLWDSMNPAVCLSPAVACTHVFMDDDVVEYNRIVPPLLRDLKQPGKPRTAALQRLYRFTDRERHKNR